MRCVSALFVTSALLTGCVDWRARDTVGEFAFVASTTLDWDQTMSITERCQETNLVMGPCGKRVSPMLYFPGTLLLHWVVSAALSGYYRTAWQWSSAGVETSTVYYNHMNGTGL